MLKTIARQKGFYIKSDGDNLAKTIEQKISEMRASGALNDLSEYVDEAISIILANFDQLEAFINELYYLVKSTAPEQLIEWDQEAVQLLSVFSKMSKDELFEFKLKPEEVKAKTERAQKILRFLQTYSEMTKAFFQLTQ